jgi:hypothetical protein
MFPLAHVLTTGSAIAENMFRPLSLFLLLAAIASSPWGLVDAHRFLPSGVTCSSQFFSPETALTVPNPKVSWASYRVFTCGKRMKTVRMSFFQYFNTYLSRVHADEPIFWLEAQVEKNQTLSITVTVPVIDRFEDARISVAVIGPSLPALDDSIVVPDDVRAYSQETGSGVAVLNSPQDQTSCDHLTAELVTEASSVVDNRCHFYEPFGGLSSWVVLDKSLNAPEVSFGMLTKS